MGNGFNTLLVSALSNSYMSIIARGTGFGEISGHILKWDYNSL